MKIGFIGTGIMGAAMAEHLMAAGHSLTVYNRTKEKAEALLRNGASWGNSPKEVASSSDVVFTIVGFPEDVREVYLGEEGLLKGVKNSALLIDMTTTNPSLEEEIQKEAEKKGCDFLDAPVTGGDIGAKNATLSIMVGGREEAFHKALPLLQLMGSNVRYMGRSGNGQRTKMANQIAIAGALGGVAEALYYAKETGLNTEDCFAVISKGAAASTQMTQNGGKLLTENYDPGFLMKHFVKDMRLAEKAGLRLPVLDLVLNECVRVMEEGGENQGTQALYRYYKEELS